MLINTQSAWWYGDYFQSLGYFINMHLGGFSGTWCFLWGPQVCNHLRPNRWTVSSLQARPSLPKSYLVCSPQFADPSPHLAALHESCTCLKAPALRPSKDESSICVTTWSWRTHGVWFNIKSMWTGLWSLLSDENWADVFYDLFSVIN